VSYTVIGIDPGVKGLGFGVVDALSGDLIQGGFVRRPSTGPQRGAKLWHQMALQMVTLIDKRNRLDLVAVEQPVSYKHSPVDPNDLIEIGMAGAWCAGIIALTCSKGPCGVLSPSPSRWKGQVPEEIMAERILGKLTETELACIEWPSSKKSRWDVLHGIGIAKWSVLESE